MADTRRIAAALMGKAPPSAPPMSNPDGDIGQDPGGEGAEDRLSQTMEEVSQLPPEQMIDLLAALAEQDPSLLDKIDALLAQLSGGDGAPQGAPAGPAA